MKTKITIPQFIKNVYFEKCPKCKSGETFRKGQHFFSIPVLHHRCPSCNYKFEREPGYFIGAMYLSYGLAILQSGIAFVLMYLLAPELNVNWVIFIIFLTILLFAKMNYKWSRLLYLYIFPW